MLALQFFYKLLENTRSHKLFRQPIRKIFIHYTRAKPYEISSNNFPG